MGVPARKNCFCSQQGLASAVQKLLLGLDWDDNPKVQILQQMTGADLRALRQWQQQLGETGIASASTSEASDVDMTGSEEHSWTPSPEQIKTQAEPDPPDIPAEAPLKTRIKRFSVHQKTTSVSRREEQSQ